MEKDLGKGGKNSFHRNVPSSYTEKRAHREKKKKTLKNRTTKDLSYSVYMQLRWLKDNICKMFRTVSGTY